MKEEYIVLGIFIIAFSIVIGGIFAVGSTMIKEGNWINDEQIRCKKLSTCSSYKCRSRIEGQSYQERSYFNDLYKTCLLERRKVIK